MISHEEHIIFVINLNLKLAYMHLKGTLTVPNTGTVAAPDNRNKKGNLRIVLHLLIPYVKKIIHK